eukprot:Seg1036.8 transcript_id=Seg1036.8/GoldUCD/mRNA.D3Y31 product="alpha-2-macroglobulin-like protein 1" protein_id=Seg1036.8/GoldUCD/D3Y31
MAESEATNKHAGTSYQQDWYIFIIKVLVRRKEKCRLKGIRLKLEASKGFDADTLSTKLCVCGGKSNTFKFKITPKKIGKIPILVKAITTGDNICAKDKKMANSVGAADAVKRMLLVEPEGVKNEYNYNTLFCPQRDGNGSSYDESFELKLPSEIVPGSIFTRFSVYGDLMGPTLTDLDKLLAMPYGCGEQNMLKFAPNIYVLQYLMKTNQLTKEIEERAKRYLISGYQRELTFKRSDGSYSAFGERDKEGSTWLTAFVLKSYVQAMKFIFIDIEEIKQSIKFLSSLQKPDGCFREVGMVHHKAMKGGITSGVTMTSFVLTALVEARRNLGSHYHDSAMVRSALRCISRGLRNVTDSYSVALLTHSLKVANSEDRSYMMTKLKSLALKEGGKTHWASGRPLKNDHKAPPVDVEMTAYALMAYLIGPKKDFLSALPIVRWLSKQRNSLGGFASTQDTCVALQALAIYGGLIYQKGTNLKVNIQASQINHTFIVNDENKLVLQRLDTPDAPTKVKIESSGKGCALLQANVKYNIPVVREVPKFYLDLKLKQTGSKCRHEVKVCASYSGKGASNMALIDVKMVSGFEPVTKHLDKILQSTTNDLLKDYEFEENKLTLYFEKIESKTCLTFPIEQTADIINRKEAYAKIYDYYNTGESATTMYSIDTCKDVNI